MQKLVNKKGLSPVVATALLVMIAIILAVIILLWANRVFSNDKIQKLGENIENHCERIQFKAEAVITPPTINIVNEGNVPLYGIKLSRKGVGFTRGEGVFAKVIRIGETTSVDLASPLQSGDEIVVAPVIIGDQGDTKRAYTCEGQAQTIQVS